MRGPGRAMGLPEEGELVSVKGGITSCENPGDRKKINSKMGPNFRVLA